jgi:hypothetical protein
MIKFHYFLRSGNLSSVELKKLSAELEEVGYKSILLPFNTSNPDYLIRSAAALIPGNKLKYMIAFRPYHVSPQYCAMLTEGFNKIDPERIILNWVPGYTYTRAYSDSQMDVYGNTEVIEDAVKRKAFLRKFVMQYNSTPIITIPPEMVFSGFSEYTLETAKIFNGTSVSVIGDYRKNKDRFDGIEKRMVSVSVAILDNQDNVEEYKNFLFTKNPSFLELSIIGTKEEVRKSLIELENEKITDVLITTKLWEVTGKSQESSKKNNTLVNDLIKEINKGESHV